MKAEKQMLSPEDVSARYSISRGTLANWRSKLQGPKFYKVKNKKILYDIRDLEMFFKSEPILTKDSVQKLAQTSFQNLMTKFLKSLTE